MRNGELLSNRRLDVLEPFSTLNFIRQVLNLSPAMNSEFVKDSLNEIITVVRPYRRVPRKELFQSSILKNIVSLYCFFVIARVEQRMRCLECPFVLAVFRCEWFRVVNMNKRAGLDNLINEV